QNRDDRRNEREGRRRKDRQNRDDRRNERDGRRRKDRQNRDDRRNERDGRRRTDRQNREEDFCRFRDPQERQDDVVRRADDPGARLLDLDRGRPAGRPRRRALATRM